MRALPEYTYILLDDVQVTLLNTDEDQLLTKAEEGPNRNTQRLQALFACRTQGCGTVFEHDIPSQRRGVTRVSLSPTACAYNSACILVERLARVATVAHECS